RDRRRIRVEEKAAEIGVAGSGLFRGARRSAAYCVDEAGNRLSLARESGRCRGEARHRAQRGQILFGGRNVEENRENYLALRDSERQSLECSALRCSLRSDGHQKHSFVRRLLLICFLL